MIHLSAEAFLVTSLVITAWVMGVVAGWASLFWVSKKWAQFLEKSRGKEL